MTNPDRQLSDAELYLACRPGFQVNGRTLTNSEMARVLSYTNRLIERASGNALTSPQRLASPNAYRLALAQLRDPTDIAALRKLVTAYADSHTARQIRHLTDERIIKILTTKAADRRPK